MKEAFALVAVIIAICGYIPYLRDAYKKRVTPHPYTWLVWSIVTGITFFGQLVKGAGIGALPTLASEIFSITILLFSLRHGFKNIAKIDHFFLIVSLLGLIPWILTKDPTISVIIAVSIDLVAFMPTIRKTWKKPESETPILYSANVLRHILTIFSLQSYNIATMLHSVAMILTNSIMTGIILFKKPIKQK
ncbi:hypothetical protein HZB74_01540 [Candidatus Saccharibacteria bacterium]|nr:hypothetical protein [Candidatus Saccharibacteria bacterium]